MTDITKNAERALASAERREQIASGEIELTSTEIVAAALGEDIA